MMAKTGIVFGLVMCGLTVACLFISMEKSLTQFIPLIFGIAFFILGIFSLNPHVRYRATLFGAGLSGFGALAGAVRFVVLWLGQRNGEEVNELSMRVIATMAVLCLAFLIWTLIWISSRQKRRGRTKSISAPSFPSSEFS